MVKKTLPPLGKDISLSKSGYKVKNSEQTRRSSLKRASKKYGTLPVLRRLNLVRNYQKNTSAEKVLTKDVNYMSDMHHAAKKLGRLPKRVTKRTSKK